MQGICLIIRGMLYDIAQKKVKIKSTETGRVMTLNIWAFTFSAQSAFHSQVSEGYTGFQDNKDRTGFPPVMAIPSVFPSIRKAITRLTLNQKKNQIFVLFSVTSGFNHVPRRMKCDCSIENWSQEIVVGREDRSEGILCKSKEERAGLGVKTMDKVSLATKVQRF